MNFSFETPLNFTKRLLRITPKWFDAVDVAATVGKFIVAVPYTKVLWIPVWSIPRLLLRIFKRSSNQNLYCQLPAGWSKLWIDTSWFLWKCYVPFTMRDRERIKERHENHWKKSNPKKRALYWCCKCLVDKIMTDIHSLKFFGWSWLLMTPGNWQNMSNSASTIVRTEFNS